MTLLERDAVETLLQEVHLDLAGLTDDSNSNPAPTMQSAFWLVSGQYESYEPSRGETELNLDVQRIFGRTKHATLHGPPGEALFRQAKREIDAAMKQSQTIIAPSTVTEIRAQMSLGKRLANLEKFDLTYPNGFQKLDAEEGGRRRRNAEEAIKAFETVLLLDPGNREAKIYLAACLRKQTIGRLDEARNYYREVLEQPVQDRWFGQAQDALRIALLESGPVESVRWLKTAVAGNVNPAVMPFYQEQLKAADSEVIIQQGDSRQTRTAAEAHLFEDLSNNFSAMQNQEGTAGGEFGMDRFVEDFGDGPAAAGRRLVELYPKMKEQFPLLAPQLMEFVVTFQSETNLPLVDEVEQSLNREIAHPDQIYRGKYFNCESRIYEWSMGKQMYDLAVKAMERKRSFNAYTGADFDDQSKISLGYAYLGAERWREALEIFETYSNRPVMMESGGPWGPGWTVVLTSRKRSLCRNKLGLPPDRSPHEFDLGNPVFCLPPHSTFAVDEQSLWICLGGQIIQLGFDLKTNRTINLPMDPLIPATVIYPLGSKIWIGTDGAGLIAFDKSSGQCEHFTVDEGLMMNRISCLSSAGNSLWIGYGYKAGLFGMDMSEAQSGGIGEMNLVTQKITSFTPSIADRPSSAEGNPDNLSPEPVGQPTRHAVQSIVAGLDGVVWFATINSPLRCFRTNGNVWDGVSSIHGRPMARNGEHLLVGDPWSFYPSVGKDTTGPLGVHLLDLRTKVWRDWGTFEGLPSEAVSTMTIHDDKLWVGGMGYVAALDPCEQKVLNFSYVHGFGIDRIQIAGGYVWAQSDQCLYRAPLSALQ